VTTRGATFKMDKEANRSISPSSLDID